MRSSKSRGISKKVRLNIYPAIKVKKLDVGKQQLVKIEKALSRDIIFWFGSHMFK